MLMVTTWIRVASLVAERMDVIEAPAIALLRNSTTQLATRIGTISTIGAAPIDLLASADRARQDAERAGAVAEIVERAARCVCPSLGAAGLRRNCAPGPLQEPRFTGGAR